ncbi:MAG TPA: hypothetical protein VF147_17660 [Vicinamibacterales bacterium]
MRFVTPFVIAAIITGCGGSSPSQPSQPNVLQVAGQYQITQQGVETSCGDGGATIPSVTATVTHAAGASSFSMRDTGGTTFSGTVQNNGDFSATAVFGPDAGGDTYTQRLEGRFSTSGFTGRLTVTVTPRGCAFTRNWTAVKQGSANVFP